MAQKDRAATAAARDPGEEFVARLASGGLVGLLRSPGQGPDVDPADRAFEFQPRRKSFDEFSIGRARPSAQLVIEMANDEPPVAKTDERIQERHGIATSGNADQVPARWRKPGDQFPGQRKRHALSRPFAPNGVKTWCSRDRRSLPQRWGESPPGASAKRLTGWIERYGARLLGRGPTARRRM